MSAAQVPPYVESAGQRHTLRSGTTAGETQVQRVLDMLNRMNDTQQQTILAIAADLVEKSEQRYVEVLTMFPDLFWKNGDIGSIVASIVFALAKFSDQEEQTETGLRRPFVGFTRDPWAESQPA